MNTLLFRCFIILVCCAFSHLGSAQTEYVVIEEIAVDGNKKTRRRVVLRELDIHVGDTLALDNMMARFAQNEYYLMNTGLFNQAKIEVREWDTEAKKIYLRVDLNEAFPILPLPIFELADRNFSVWWTEMQRDFSRVNFGMRLYHFNLTGNRDRIRGTAQWGYTRKGELDYDLPGLNRRKTLGAGINMLFTRNKELAYRTVGNELQFQSADGDFLHRRRRFAARVYLRPELFTLHEFRAAFYRHRITDFVKDQLNPDFFGNDQTQQRWLELTYRYETDRRDIRPYPLHGHYLAGTLRKVGLGVYEERDAFDLTTRVGLWRQLGDSRFSTELIAQGRYSFVQKQQPYYATRALGYEEDYLRGYEFYVIDGLDYFYQKSTLRYELFSNDIDWGKLSPIESFRVMPTRVYLTLNSDIGYARDRYYAAGNPLSNSFLWGGGPGLDIIVFYRMVAQIEYSWNRKGESGLFLHLRFGNN